jgi:hypothetical protein|tara:strand:- start:55 stop:339 length:285 start_codon:yes stop_codon:yes gene_type:complete
MEKDYLQEALGKFNVDKNQWYGWKKDFTGDKRMSYENIILNDKTATMPSEADVNAKIQELKDADTAKANNKTSGKKKLKDLGLSDNEINALLGV